MIIPLTSLTLFSALILAAVAQDIPPTEEFDAEAFEAEAFEAEKTVLSTADVTDYPELQFEEAPPDLDLDAPYAKKHSRHSCKIQPEDNAWPLKALWSTLDVFVGGNLEKPMPLAASCYLGANYNAATCANLVATWGDSDLQ